MRKTTTSRSRTPDRSTDIRVARSAVAQWDRIFRQQEAGDAQTAYLYALVFADEHRERTRQRTKLWPKAKREREIRGEDRYAAQCVRDARRLANSPTIYSKRVTGRDIEQSIGKTVPRESRHLAGITGSRTNHLRLLGSPTFYGSNERSESLTLRSGGGRILAHVVVAGVERELYAHLFNAVATWQARSA